MAEMIDAEPYVIEGLAKSGAACAMPCSAMTDQVADLDASVSSEVRCYALQAPKVQRDRVAVPD